MSIEGSYVVQSVDDVRSVVQECVSDGTGLIPVGGAVRVHIGYNCVKSPFYVSTRSLNNILEYNPDDLVVCAEAGMTLTNLQSRLAEANQWLPIDVAFPDQQTIGGIVASRSNSTLRAGYGSVRDWLIGVELVNSSSEVVVGGGKVVKNVAGYDLPRLYCGSWGTLGFLTKINFKVSPRPEASRSLLLLLSGERNAEALLDLLQLKLKSTTSLLFNDDAAIRLLGSDAARSQYLFLHFKGLVEDVEALAALAADYAAPFSESVIALPEQVALTLLRSLTDFTAIESPLSATYHVLSSQVGAHIRMVEWTAAKFGLRAEIVSDTSAGIVTAHLFEINPGNTDWMAFLPVFQDKALRVGGSLIIERMPALWREADVPVWSPILSDFKLMKLIKEKLDPAGVFSPGRFIGRL